MFKFVAVLKGPQTLFYDLPIELRNTFIKKRSSRKFLDEWIDKDQALSPKKGEGAIFIVGDKYTSTAHSEPPITEERLFFGIIPGSAEQVEQIRKRWYPNVKHSSEHL